MLLAALSVSATLGFGGVGDGAFSSATLPFLQDTKAHNNKIKSIDLLVEKNIIAGSVIKNFP